LNQGFDPKLLKIWLTSRWEIGRVRAGGAHGEGADFYAKTALSNRV
jgi:hypothetical protein